MTDEAVVKALVVQSRIGIDALLYALDQMITTRFPNVAKRLPAGFRPKMEAKIVEATERAAAMMASTGAQKQQRKFQAYTALLGLKAELVFLTVDAEKLLSQAEFDEALWTELNDFKDFLLPFLADVVHVAMTTLLASVASRLGGQ